MGAAAKTGRSFDPCIHTNSAITHWIILKSKGDEEFQSMHFCSMERAVNKTHTLPHTHSHTPLCLTELLDSLMRLSSLPYFSVI